jgi:hypothetical protein
VFEDPGSRLDAAEQLAGHYPGAAAPAFAAIAGDREAGDEVRLSAAGQLTAADPRTAAEAFSAIASDREVGDDVRMAASEQLAGVGSPGRSG